MSEIENSTQEQKPKISKSSIWVVIIVVSFYVAVSLCVAFQILSLKHFLIFAAIFLPVMFFGRLLIEIILSFIRARKYAQKDEQKQ